MTTAEFTPKNLDQSYAMKRSVSLLILLAGSLLVGFSTGRWSAPLAAWIGPVLIMRYARDHKVGRGFGLVFAANVLALLIGYLVIWLGFPTPILIPFLAIIIGLLWSLQDITISTERRSNRTEANRLDRDMNVTFF